MTRSFFRRHLPGSVRRIGSGFSGDSRTPADPDRYREQLLLLDMEGQFVADVYHQGRDHRGLLAMPPALSGDEMDEAGW